MIEGTSAGLVKDAEVAAYLGTTRNQLARMRHEGYGPPYCKLGRSVRYRWADVLAWVEDGLKVPSSKGGVRGSWK